MAKYRKKSIVIDAFEFGTESPDWFVEAVGEGKIVMYGRQKRRPGQDTPCCEISTLEGDMIAIRGDWIIKGIKGEMYPCKPDIFAATYDPA